MRQEVETFIKQNANNYLNNESYSRSVDVCKLVEELRAAFPGITDDELRETVPAVLHYAR